MTMVVSVNAQRYYHRRVYPHSAAYYRSLYSNINYRYNGSYTSSNSEECQTSWMRHFVTLGFGIGGGAINPTGNYSHSSFDMDLICMNVLMSLKLGSRDDTSKGYRVSDSDGGVSLQFGALIPILTFDKSEYLWGQKGKIFIAPLIGFIKSEDTIYDGFYLHENSRYHTCSYWISDNHETDTSCTEYGGAVMVKYGCGYLLGKVTNKSWGVSVGVCM
jgi:hypothetical protein